MNSTIDYEGKVTGIWDLILHHYFPSTEEYVHRPQDKMEGGFLDIHTAHWIRDQECLFLVTQTKREARDIGEQAGDEGEAQLKRYLGSQERLMRSRQGHVLEALSISGGKKRFGIVAVGRRCRFYEYRRGGLSYMDNDKTKYELVTDVRIVHELLSYIRTNH